MPPHVPKNDPLSLSNHLKLCGFLNLVVSLPSNTSTTPPRASTSGSSVDSSNPCGETPDQCSSLQLCHPQQRCDGSGHFKANESCCSSEVVEEPSSLGFCEGGHGCLANDSPQSASNVSGKLTCVDVNCHAAALCKQSEFCPREGGSNGSSPIGVHNALDGLPLAIDAVLTGEECWLAEEASEVLLHTNRGFVLRSVNSGRHQQDCLGEDTWVEKTIADKLRWIAADSGQGCFGTTDSDLTTDVGKPCLGSAEKGPCSEGSEEGNGASSAFSASEKSPLCSLKLDLEAESAQLTPQSHQTNIAGEVKENTDGKTRRKAGHAIGSGNILHNLQLLTARNYIKIKGHVVLVASRAADVRAVVLLDLYLSSCLWAGRNYWKPGPIAAAVLNHISCEWDTRKKYLAAATCQGQKLDNLDIKDLWNLVGFYQGTSRA